MAGMRCGRPEAKQFRHAEKPGLVTVPHPKKELPIGTLKSISKASDVPLP